MRRSPRGPLLARSPASCGTAASNLAVASQTVTSETYGCRPAEIPRGGSSFSYQRIGPGGPISRCPVEFIQAPGASPGTAVPPAMPPEVRAARGDRQVCVCVGVKRYATSQSPGSRRGLLWRREPGEFIQAPGASPGTAVPPAMLPEVRAARGDRQVCVCVGVKRYATSQSPGSRRGLLWRRDLALPRMAAWNS